MKREYSVVYQEVEDGWIMATVPELPGAVTQGKDLAEARSMIKEAVELLRDEIPTVHVPRPDRLEAGTTDPGDPAVSQESPAQPSWCFARDPP